jgi:hypothetical protein
MKYLPAFTFPPTHWWAYLMAEEAQVDLSEFYVKQTFRNRFIVAAVNGPVSLTIPVSSTKGIKVPMKDIRISDHRWVNSYSTTLRSAYGRSAYFEHYFDEISLLLNEKHDFLLDLNIASIEWCSKKLKLTFPIVFNQEDVPNNGGTDDLRNVFEPASNIPNMPHYPQVFSDRHAFMQGLSIIDVLFNMGPKAIDYLLLKNFSSQ